MNEEAKAELEHRVSLYQFYIGSYTKGIAFFLAITGALLKFAVDSTEYRSVFAVVGLLCNAAVLIPLLYGARHERQIARDFTRLAEATHTKSISTGPLRMLVVATATFWVILCVGWLYVLLWLK